MTQDLKDKAIDILNRTTVEGPKLRLPDEEIDHEVWTVVKEALTEAGAQYNKKTKVFLSTTPIEALANAKAWLQEQETVTYEAPVLYDGPETIEVEAEEDPKHETTTFKKDKRSLRYDFTAIEAHELAVQLAEKTKELEALEAEKSAIAANFSAKSKQIKGRLSELSGLVTTGYEYRDVDVEIHYNKPEPGKKTIIRLDTNKATVEKMEYYEFNLFNQPAGEGVEA